MGEVHDILTAKGKREAAASGLDRGVIEAAAAYLASEENSVGFLYSGWCQSALPHKRLPDASGWQIRTEHVGLVVEPGMRMGPGTTPIPVGVPYGSRARLILIYLQSEALRTGQPEVELGRSLRQWLGRMGINSGGRDIKIVRDQAERISRCRLTFEVRAGKGVGLLNQSIVETAMFIRDADDQNGSLFAESVRLSDGFFRELRKHPVPLEDSALRILSNNSQAIDIYCWLAYRLHVLPAPRSVSWTALKGQFGQGVARSDNFRRLFLPNLALALAVYPAAKVEVGAGGLVLHPSRPPVAPKLVSAGQ